ncbi:MAG: MATE family efflux transporter [Methanomassiliicoccaceae archaeon]|nr:MATE family efflux transporter [Methanomassiliicoccaceae archaeon]
MTDAPLTKDVEIMLGSHKKAIVRMAIPMIVAMFASSINGLVDAAWISGLGPDALAAIGILFPLFFIVVGVSSGISVGASSAIARYIGAGSKANAERTASVAFTLTIITGAVFSVIMLVVTKPLLMIIGGADVIDLCMDYANVMFVFAIAFFINALLSSILRSEGSARRSMAIMITAAVLNLVLDPIFIYTFGWGMAGAAFATAVALTLASVPAVYWFFIRKDTYIRLRIGRPHFDKAITKDIFRVGLPASVEFVAISVAVMLTNIILIGTAEGTDAVAIYTTGWRTLNIIMIPCIGIGAALVPIAAAAYGGRDNQKVRSAYMYSLKISLIMMFILAAALAAAAGLVSSLFSYSGDTAYLHYDMTLFIRISCTFLPFIGFGILSSSVFQALGMGTRALVSTAFRGFIIVPAAYAASFTGRLVDIWWATAVMEVIGPVAVLIWCLLTLRALTKGRFTYSEH